MVTWREELEEARSVLDDVRYYGRNRNNTVSTTNWNRLGAVSDYIGRVLSRDLVESTAPPIEEPVEPPWSGRETSDAIAVLRGFAARVHWPGSMEGPYAMDWYPDANEQGQSDGIPISWPIGGVVRRAGALGPMMPRTGHDAPDVSDWAALPAAAAARWEGKKYRQSGKYGQEILWTAILFADNGVSYGFTHVDQEIIEGRAEAGEIFAWVDSSGIGMFKAAGLQPGHIHLACYHGAPSGWGGGQGNLAAFDEARRLGFQIREVARIPSPMDYMNFRARAGKFV